MSEDENRRYFSCTSSTFRATYLYVFLLLGFDRIQFQTSYIGEASIGVYLFKYIRTYVTYNHICFIIKGKVSLVVERLKLEFGKLHIFFSI